MWQRRDPRLYQPLAEPRSRIVGRRLVKGSKTNFHTRVFSWRNPQILLSKDLFGRSFLTTQLRQRPHWTNLALTMPTLLRVEFSRGLRPDSPRFVLIIEIPDSAVAELSARKVSLETRAYEIASEIRSADRSGKPESHMSLMSCTRAKVKSLEALGEPNLLAPDACRAWVIKRPSELQELLDKGWQSRQKKPGSSG
jgi:hypothetical protein